MDPSVEDYVFCTYLNYDICTKCRVTALHLDVWGNPYDTDP